MQLPAMFAIRYLCCVTVHTVHQHSESFQMPSTPLSAIQPNLYNHQQRYFISLYFLSPCMQRTGTLPIFTDLDCTFWFKVQFLCFTFQLRADSEASRFFPACPLCGLAPLPTSQCPLQVHLTLQGSWLQQGDQLVTPNSSTRAPWFSLSKTVFLSWLFQLFLLILC